MSTLDRAMRKKLSDTIIAARQVAEEAAADAVRRLGIIEDGAPPYLTPDQKALRVRLRAHARTLGDGWNIDKKKLLTTKQLENEAAYEIWHRMLFGRFLVERGLLIHPDLGVPVAASELVDLAQEAGEADPWALVERFAAPSLPAVFKPDDPVLAMTLDPSLSKRLRDLVAGLPTEVFAADDSLGWTYQFWRTVEKDAVNEAGGKIGADELPAVTQLFTEPYMVKFLLHNTLGAWWAGKVLADNPNLALDALDEQTLRNACALPGIDWEYLRFVRDRDEHPWSPAAGYFPDWPTATAEITYCDPCCGSGHFLVEAFAIFVALRQHQEGLVREEAVRAVLTDNLHGLEIDGRCVQIAAFNVALAAWKVAGRPISLPQPNIAWVGAPPPFLKAEAEALAGCDVSLRLAFTDLHKQFEQAPLLGSLLNVGAHDLLNADLRTRNFDALEKLRAIDPELREGAIAARGLLSATDLLAKKYVLLATNVPFLGYRDMSKPLLSWVTSEYPETKGDLGYCLWSRMLKAGATVAVVSLQHWMSAISYKDFRLTMLSSHSVHLVCYLGVGAFETISGSKVNVTLSIVSSCPPKKNASIEMLDVASCKGPAQKSEAIQSTRTSAVAQKAQISNPAHTLRFIAPSTSTTIGDYADCFAGIMNGDTPRFVRFMWEMKEIKPLWALLQSTTVGYPFTGGRSQVIFYDEEEGHLREDKTIRRVKLHNSDERGNQIWGKTGIAIDQMDTLRANLYYGQKYDSNVAIISPKTNDALLPLLTFCSSSEFLPEVRAVERKLNITNATFSRVPFSLEKWRALAQTRYPVGFPQPYSDDPTQWLFHGHPAFAEKGTELQVTLARVAGFRWPAERDAQIDLTDLARERLSIATALRIEDDSGILALCAAGDKRSLADKLRSMLTAAYRAPLTVAKEHELVRAADATIEKREYRDLTLEGWLQDRAFRQHCMLFQNRPFLWHLWDGLPDGFSIFVNYHRLDHGALEKVTFSLLGDWVANARAEGRTAHENQAAQLQQRLRTILEGECPHDVFVRWKPLDQQSIGWQPDLNDGVGVNIRPFMLAGVLRDQPRISLGKDRGTDVSSAPWYHLGPEYNGKKGDRINNHHLTLAEKTAARGQKK